MLSECFHLLETDAERPQSMNNPLDYVPHPLCIAAAEQVKAYLQQKPDWTDEVQAGKMFGVLVCENGLGQLGFLAAYSGQIGGHSDWPWFVPAVFDYLQPDGYFKQEEQAISDLNRQVKDLESSSDYVSAKAEVKQLRNEAECEILAFRNMMHEAKARRDAQRDTVDEAVLIRESQFQKAELRRLKKHWQERFAAAEACLRPFEEQIEALKHERCRRSDALQRWLFDQFVMLNAEGERRTLTQIFSTTTQGVPPSGAGECCAPKLLQYAYAHNLRPLQMAEFWQGRSPRMEIRHHNQFYTACRGKCKPILEWMQPSLSSCSASSSTFSLPLLFSDETFIVIDKPSGLLSVPGKNDEPSVESLLREQYGEVYMVHRLDQDTSGLMVVALTKEAYHHLQQQFLTRVVYKRYIAVLDGELSSGVSGTIRLPLRPDPMDRPRQLVDYVHGKEAVTDYEVLSVGDGHTVVSLTPHTGRTHQLRMHCAHADGLATPIVGDVLYGRPADRLLLHASVLAFDHPETGQRLRFESPAPF